MSQWDLSRRGMLMGGLSALALCGLPWGYEAHAQGFPDVVERVKSAVVGIGTYQAIRSPQSALMGTGFAVTDGNHIVTNYHVVRDHQVALQREYLAVFVGHGENFDVRQAELVAKNAAHDLAVLKIGGDPLPVVDLGPRLNLARDGTDVAITGFPLGPVFGLYPATHTGIVAAVTPSRAPVSQARLLDATTILRDRFDVYQLDLVAYPGNSGSPLYDRVNGRVLAVLNSTFIKETREQALQSPSGISFAIPIKYVYLLLDQLGF